MKTASFVTRCTCTILSASFVFGLGLPSHAEDIPPYMQSIAGRTAASPAETATKNVLALNTGMFELYDDAAKIIQKNILSQHPSSSACSPVLAGGSFYIARAWRRSKRHRCRLFISC